MKKIILALALAAVATVAVVASASADVPRYQTQQGTLTVTLASPYNWVHTFNITLNPCDNTISGTGSATLGVGGANSPEAQGEQISGTLVDGILTFKSTYTNGYSWSYSGPLASGTASDSNGTTFGITSTTNLVSSTWRNHGDYVKNGGDPTSCIGLPIAWSQSGTINSNSPTGSTITLPDNGTYRITVSGTWLNTGKNVADAEYTSVDNWASHMDGYDINGYLLGAGFGDVQVNNGFVNWGGYNANHAYSLTTALTGTSVNLGVFDGDSNTNLKNASWYGDNSGSLNYTITYVGP